LGAQLFAAAARPSNDHPRLKQQTKRRLGFIEKKGDIGENSPFGLGEFGESGDCGDRQATPASHLIRA
jgi:hypothetical protein